MVYTLEVIRQLEDNYRKTGVEWLTADVRNFDSIEAVDEVRELQMARSLEKGTYHAKDESGN